MMHAVWLGFLVMFLALDVCVVVLAVTVRKLYRRLDTVSTSMVELQRAMGIGVQGPIPNGRGFPTPEELANARNRMDRLGVAHPGSWKLPQDPDRPAA